MKHKHKKFQTCLKRFMKTASPYGQALLHSHQSGCHLPPSKLRHKKTIKMSLQIKTDHNIIAPLQTLVSGKNAKTSLMLSSKRELRLL